MTLRTLFYTVKCFRRRQWHPTPVLLPGKSHGRRSLVGCSPWGREELDTTERLHFHFSLSCIGEGNGNPLQCSGLENPRDWGAWWAAIYGVLQSRTRLKWLSSLAAAYSIFKSLFFYEDIIDLYFNQFWQVCLVFCQIFFLYFSLFSFSSGTGPPDHCCYCC